MSLTNEEIKKRKHSMDVNPFMELPIDVDNESIEIVSGMTERYLRFQTRLFKQSKELDLDIEKLIELSDYYGYNLTNFMEENKFKEYLKYQINKEVEIE